MISFASHSESIRIVLITFFFSSPPANEVVDDGDDDQDDDFDDGEDADDKRVARRGGRRKERRVCSAKPTDRLFGTRPISSFGAVDANTLNIADFINSCLSVLDQVKETKLKNPARNHATRHSFESVRAQKDQSLKLCESCAKKRNQTRTMFRDMVRSSL